MRFWDSSAIIPLVLDEPTTDAMKALVQQERTMHVWWAASFECISAIARAERSQAGSARVQAALERLQVVRDEWIEIAPSETVRRTAERLLRVHPLRTGDALQLASAVVLADDQPSSVDFVCLDDRLRDAARREGFVVLPHGR